MQILYPMENFRKNSLNRRGRSLWAGLAFEEKNPEFELLETERGIPGVHGKKRDRVQMPTEEKPAPASASLRENRARLEEQFRARINPDFIFRSFHLSPGLEALAVFINGMARSESINDFILRPAMEGTNQPMEDLRPADYMEQRVLAVQETELASDWDVIVAAILEGRTAVFLEGDERSVLLDTRGFVSRTVGEPQNETVVMGPKEAFTENLRNNVTLIRRILKVEDLVCSFRHAGGRNNVRLVVAYREGVANESLVMEVKRRIARIDVEMLLSTGTLEQLTEARPYCPLPQALTTERPDRTAVYLMQGHVAVLLEGAPFALIAPATLFTLLSSPEDSYLRQPIGTIVRLVRYFGGLLSILMPAYFIALCLHHQGMLSGEVLSTVTAARRMVFLPLPVEMIFMLLIFQLVREAGLSVPGVLGQSVGIIGGLIMGQAAVSANIVSTVVLIIVALTGLGNFTIHDYETQLAASYFRLALVLAAWAGGLLGVTVALFLSLCYLGSLKSYGVPFLAPLSPKTYARGPVLVRGRVENGHEKTDYVNPGRRPV